MMNPILYAVTVDTEEEWDWSRGWPVRSYGTQNLAQVPRFQRLCAGHGAHVTWFFNYVALQASGAREMLQELASQSGTEVGMHIHPWTTPPYRPGRGTHERDSFLATYSPGEIREKLQSVWEAFQAMGLTPTSFRGGRYSSGGEIHRFLMERGFVADASIVPYTHWPDDGAPDYRHRDLFPRRVAGEDDSRFLWEIPVTLGFTRRSFYTWSQCYQWLSRRPFCKLRLIGILERLKIVRRVWLNFEDTSADAMGAMLRVIRRIRPPCVVFTVHSSSLHAGGNPYSRSAEQVKGIWETIDVVLSRIEADPDFQPATISQIAHTLEAQHESHRNQSAGQGCDGFVRRGRQRRVRVRGRATLPR